jgi:hypothetical protein
VVCLYWQAGSQQFRAQALLGILQMAGGNSGDVILILMMNGYPMQYLFLIFLHGISMHFADALIF